MPRLYPDGPLLLALFCCIPPACFAQPPDAGSAAPSLPRIGVAAGISTLGPSIQAATAVTRRSNVRVGFSDFSYGLTFDKDGIAYEGTLTMRSAEVIYDQYLKGPFHVSPGLMFYDGNQASASITVSAGQRFTLGSVPYFSQGGNPVAGTGAISSRTVAPVVLIGFGNLLPRSHRHFTVNFDLGVVFQGSPSATLHLSGGACNSAGTACVDAASNPVVQANVLSEQTRINQSLTAFRFYPVLSLTFGYKF